MGTSFSRRSGLLTLFSSSPSPVMVKLMDSMDLIEGCGTSGLTQYVRKWRKFLFTFLEKYE